MKNQKMKNPSSQENIDKNRRKFLALVLIGSGTFLFEKFFGPLFSKFVSTTPTKADLSNKSSFGNFQVVEKGKVLSVYDNSGEEIFQIDKGE